MLCAHAFQHAAVVLLSWVRKGMLKIAYLFLNLTIQ